jgi:hypothetical protein
MTERAAAAAGVESAGAINHLPLAGDQWGLSFTIAGRPAPSAGEIPGATWRTADAGYFRAMKLRLLKGRLFSEQDKAAKAVVVEGRWLITAVTPQTDALGRVDVTVVFQDGTTVTIEDGFEFEEQSGIVLQPELGG